jgi:hypothetical protein
VIDGRFDLNLTSRCKIISDGRQEVEGNGVEVEVAGIRIKLCIVAKMKFACAIFDFNKKTKGLV